MKNLIIICILLFTSCHLTLYNQEQDKKDGERIVNRFYQSIIENKYENTIPLFANVFWSKISKEKMLEVFAKNDSLYGKLQSFQIKDCKTTNTSGDIKQTNYAFAILNQYEKERTEEVLEMVKQSDDSIRIVFYHIKFLSK